MRHLITALVVLASAGISAPTLAAAPCDTPVAVCPGAGQGAPLIVAGHPARIEVSDTDLWGVRRAATDVQGDLDALAGVSAPPAAGAAPTVVIAGTLGHSPVIDRLAREGQLDVTGVAGRWEAFVQQVVDNPEPGVAHALVIAGADKRGTIFGLYDLSRRAGVSPWAWWADVPVPRRPDLYVAPGRNVEAPTVKYRGIFLNDEDPSLKGWVDMTYGGFNHRFYGRVFELILRLKGNFLWPAMWDPKAFAVDDPDNPRTADAYGVVMGTSHHEPMMRAHEEWALYGHGGAWDYTVNAPALQSFWRQGIERMGSNESLVTVGMRGDGDEPMTQGTAVALLERIVADQRKIITEVTGKPADQTPQVWALYKEVQDYYDQGMRVPDDVTLLFSDDNWGNIRRLPALDAKRSGGYGVYYHFDYVGGPRNYKWINTNQIERTFEQMRLAHEYGADQLWIVNVGDLKPMELPISFFLDYAWSPDAWPAQRVAGYTRDWAAEQFGPEHADDIADLLTGYTQWNARRKPELLDQNTFSTNDYREFERVTGAWDALAAKAETMRHELPPGYDDAYVQLVAYPVEASANLNRLYYATALNRLYASQGRAEAGAMADEAKALFRKDADLTQLYNLGEAHGKWDHMMDQSHIGYVTWRDPPANVMPAEAKPGAPAAAGLGVALEGSAQGLAAGQSGAVALSRYGAPSRYVEVFDRGAAPLGYRLSADTPWITLSSAAGQTSAHDRVEIGVDWTRAPQGQASGAVTVTGADGGQVVVRVAADNAAAPPAGFTGFVEGDGVVALEAAHYDQAAAAGGVGWEVIPALGRSLSGVTSTPVTAPSAVPGQGAQLDYRLWLTAPGQARLQVTTAPSLDFRGKGGLRFAVSVDDGPPHLVNLEADPSQAAWSKAVTENAWRPIVDLGALAAGPHTLRLWRVDPGVVFERAVIDLGGLRPSDLGPPESLRVAGAG